eukprot:TRINITY_DN8090_c0_g2_i1.p1 TRINITY_DN8090_c0_g2~~TRINITY_DN8090_c0_g2_i1.p1  ORF type:complete len:530 (-),score=94.03 TRINITY_DN8090_c0_g2_i1:530-1933(-)
MRDGSKGPEYFVKWKDWPDESNTWEPRCNLTHCAELVETFHQQNQHKENENEAYPAGALEIEDPEETQSPNEELSNWIFEEIVDSRVAIDGSTMYCVKVWLKPQDLPVMMLESYLHKKRWSKKRKPVTILNGNAAKSLKMNQDNNSSESNDLNDSCSACILSQNDCDRKRPCGRCVALDTLEGCRELTSEETGRLGIFSRGFSDSTKNVKIVKVRPKTDSGSRNLSKPRTSKLYSLKNRTAAGTYRSEIVPTRPSSRHEFHPIISLPLSETTIRTHPAIIEQVTQAPCQPVTCDTDDVIVIDEDKSSSSSTVLADLPENISHSKQITDALNSTIQRSTVEDFSLGDLDDLSSIGEQQEFDNLRIVSGSGSTNRIKSVSAVETSSAEMSTRIRQNDSDYAIAVNTKPSVKRRKVEQILNHRTNRHTKQSKYWVKWQGFSSEHNTWEPEENLGDDGSLLKEYKLSQGMK